MKKLLSILLVSVFTLSTLGLQVSVHHCMGKDSYSIFGLDINKHCKCKHNSKGHKPSCCNDTTLSFVSTEDPFTSNKTISFQNFSCVSFLKASYLLLSLTPYKNLFTSEVAHAPPERSTDLSSLFCIFRI